MHSNETMPAITEDRLSPLWEGAAGLGVCLTPDQRGQFVRYAAELSLWNAKMNLVSIKSPLDLPVRHFLDSLTPLACLGEGASTLIDLGSGAGFPGLPIKIVRPDLDVCLLEASRRRCSFLREVIRTLGLNGIRVMNRRAETSPGEAPGGGRYDVVISRATWKLAELIERGAPYLKAAGRLIAMKGIGIEGELKQAAPAAVRQGLGTPEIRRVRLPVVGEGRALIVYQKDLLLDAVGV